MITDMVHHNKRVLDDLEVELLELLTTYDVSFRDET